MKKSNFLTVTFMFLGQISVTLLVLNTFRLILALFGSFGEIQKSKVTELRCPPFGNHDAINVQFIFQVLFS